MKYLICISLLLCFIASIQANLKIVQCPGRRGAVVKKFELDGCSSYPCLLKRGSNSTLRLEFQANQRVNNLKLKIAGIIAGKEVPFGVPDNDHCRNAVKNGKCPLAKGKSYKYEYSLPVLAQYPKVSVVIKFEIVDQIGKSVVCLTWPSQLV